MSEQDRRQLSAVISVKPLSFSHLTQINGPMGPGGYVESSELER